MAPPYETGQPSTSSDRCVFVLRWIGGLFAVVGVIISVASVIMTAMHTDGGVRFPAEGLLLFLTGLSLMLVSLCYGSYAQGRRPRTAGRQNSVLSTNIDPPPSYWEVCDLGYDNPVIGPTVITEGGVIIVPTSRLRTISEGVVINVDTLQEIPDEPLPKYEDVVLR